MILITGAGGALGRHVLDAVRARGLTARGSGRGAPPPDADVEWRHADLVSGEGLTAAMVGVTVVIHCASDPLHPADDVRAIDTLIREASVAKALIVHVGIAGIEDAAAVSHYYRAKLACEERLAESGAAHAICRATQFHSLVERILDQLRWGAFQLYPPVRLQPVDATFVAARLVDHALAKVQGRTADIHGPETLNLRALAESWLQIRRHRRLLLPVPSFGRMSAFSRLRQVDGQTGGASWHEWLHSRYADRRL